MGINHNIFKPKALAVTTATAFPAPITKTGTISHVSGTTIVTGTGTLLMRDAMIGDYIYVASATAGSRLRKVVDVTSNDVLIIESSFGSTLSGVAFTICKSGLYNKVDIQVTGGSSGKIEGVTIPTGKTVSYYNQGGLAPIEVDGSSSGDLLITSQLQS